MQAAPVPAAATAAAPAVALAPPRAVLSAESGWSVTVAVSGTRESRPWDAGQLEAARLEFDVWVGRFL